MFVVQMFATTTARSIDSLEQELAGWEDTVSQVRFHQVELLRQLDVAQVAAADGCRTMIDWVASRLDVSRPIAKDLLVVARAQNSQIDQMLQSGVIGLERAVALIRLYNTGAGEELMADALGLDLGGLWRLVASRERLSAEDEVKGFSDRFLVMQPSLDESWWKLWGGLPGPDGQVVEKALLARADEFPRLEGEDRSQRMADALTSLALDSLTGGSEEASGREVVVAEVLVDAQLAAATSGEAGVVLSSGPKVGANVLSEILCTGQIRVIVADQAGNRVDYSDLGEAIPPALRTLIWARDQGVCTVDGCSSRYRLQPHHIVPRSQGGSHHPSNLTLLCWFHHHVVIHGLGFRLDPDSPPQRRRFIRQPHLRGPPGIC
ncbi:MAG TPA: HNH endonuclease signature motif containing protein [Acidimicrobiia bacterium]|nr:HNH endonuclease signature motif containing protein [Acidimicrobiia bacterium]